MSSDASVSALVLENARLRSKLAEVTAALAASSHRSQQPNEAEGGDGADEPGVNSGTAAGEREKLVNSTGQPPASLQPPPSPLPGSGAAAPSCGLSLPSILRYSRHLLLSELGNRPTAFVRAVQSSSVLVIGAGGLGCPALLYLAAAGVGRLGVVDGDVVDPSNLPRQVLYTDRHVGRNKAEAACARLRAINGECVVSCHPTAFVPSNAESICRGYDVLLDCSDNVATRYLCNDVCVLLGIPCVSASALRLEGQLSVYGSRVDGGPCYRCLFPLPVSSHLVTNCNEGGILNAVTGVMGTMQALEALKCIALSRQAAEEQQRPLGLVAPPTTAAALSTPASADTAAPSAPYRCPALSSLSGRLVVFDGCSSTFRSVKLRGRSAQCAVCGDSEWRRISLQSLREQHYSAMCSADGTATFDDHAPTGADVAAANQSALLHVSGISVRALASHLHQSEPRPPFVVLDVRPSLQFDIAHLPHSLNVPREQLSRSWPDVERAVQHATADYHRATAAAAAAQGNTAAAASSTAATLHLHKDEGSGGDSDGGNGSGSVASGAAESARCRLFVVCRRGVDSLHAARWICEQKQQQQQQQSGADVTAPPVSVDVLNVEGGLMAWSEQVDRSFPFY